MDTAPKSVCKEVKVVTQIKNRDYKFSWGKDQIFVYHLLLCANGPWFIVFCFILLCKCIANEVCNNTTNSITNKLCGENI